jgi:glycosyltransferase involved in cell wall biosynthesis
MNILILDNSVAFTGAFKCALNEAKLLSDQHRFVFVLPEQSKVISLLKQNGFPVYTLPLKEISRSKKAVLQYPFFLVSNLFRLRKIVKEERIDIVQVNDFYNLLGAALKATGYKGKLLTWVRFLPQAMPSALVTLWTAVARKYADKIVAVSDAVLGQLPRSSKNVRLYDPVQLDEHRTEEKAVNDKLIRLLYLSNFTRGKGQEHAVEAFSLAFRQNSNLRLKFIGGDMGLEKNMAFRQELMKLVGELHLDNTVSFHDFSADVEREIKTADIVLNFSEAESFSMTCLESSFYGTPVIATRCGGPEEIIKDGETGLLISPKDIDGMANAILRLAGDSTLRQEFSKAGKIYTREKFNTNNFKRSFLEIIQ